MLDSNKDSQKLEAMKLIIGVSPGYLGWGDVGLCCVRRDVTRLSCVSRWWPKGRTVRTSFQLLSKMWSPRTLR